MSETTRPRRVLIVTYVFPPVGGAGVQRSAKFVKYLPGFGWHGSVLTASNPSVPVHDASLSADLPDDTLIRRARTLEPSYEVKNLISTGGDTPVSGVARLPSWAKGAARSVVSKLLQPDPQVLWYPAAVKEGRLLLKSVPHDAVLATGPPFSCFLVAAALSRRTGLPLVLDYRDEWELTNRFQENKRFGPITQGLNRFMEHRIARMARVILATSDASARSLEAMRDRCGGRAPVHCIRNGFDPDDFTGDWPARDTTPERRYRLVYTGTLFSQTSVKPLVVAIEQLCLKAPSLGAHLEVVFAGRRTADQDALLGRLSGLPVEVTLYPYLDHTAAVGLMRSADLLCSILADAPGAARALTAKVFEYMAARRPILAITPPGDLWDVLEDYPAADRFLPSDVSGIAACLVRRIEARQSGAAEPSIVWDGTRYDRREQSRALAGVLSEIVRRPLGGC